jgi:hypothetical protein
MNYSRYKEQTLAIFLAILMISSIAMIATPAKAQLAAAQPTVGALPSGITPSITISTVSYLSVSPNPIGVNQPLLINVWTQPPININRQYIGSYQIVITKPDGSQDKLSLSSYAGDATAWTTYVPDKEGNYTIQFNFLGEYFPAGQYFSGYIVTNSSGQNLNSAYYSPSSSPPLKIVVQQDLIASWPPAPLPTDYWTRPVSPNNREWWTILGCYPSTGYSPVDPAYMQGVTWDSLYPNTSKTWSSTGNFVPYVQAPNTAHILWSRVVGIGGLIGGQLGDITARPDATPSPTAGSWLYPQIIYAGRCYQTLTKVIDGVTTDVWECYDLRTGQIYWDKLNSLNFSVSQAPTLVSYTKRASQAVAGEEAMMRGLGVSLVYIGSGRLLKYDPFTGSTLINASISPLSTGTYYSDEYVLSVQDLGAAAGANRYRLINWTTNDAGVQLSVGTTVTYANTLAQRVAGNITWPISSLPGTTDYTTGVAVQVGSINPSGVSGTGVTIGQFMVGISLTTGQVLWNVSTVQKGDGSESFFSTVECVADNGVFIARGMEGNIMAWDLNTGKLKWTTQLAYPWGEFGAYHVATGYGIYISGAYDGVYGINEATGKIEWHFRAYTPYEFETPYQTDMNGTEYAFHVGVQIADGKLYVSSAEHTPSEPLTRGLNLYCVNMTTGKEIWNYSASQVDQSRAFTGAIAEGYLVFGSEYDATMYVFGKGQSATTVSVPQTQITTGESAIISGTVLDQSPGQPGTPCVSAQSMNAWMDHLHAQYPVPANVMGVPVSIDAFDPNNNIVHIATVTSDMSGTFSYVWAPTIAGLYKITATFVGDDSYGSSYAQAAAVVVNAPQATPTQTSAPINAATTSDLMTYMVAGVIAIIIAIAVVGVLLLRKRP